MNNKLSIKIFFAALTILMVLSVCSQANPTYSLQPNPADVYNLVHQNYYIWQVNLTIPSDQTLIYASLTFDNINDWRIEPGDKLYISLLSKSGMNSAVTKKKMKKASGSDIYTGTDNETASNALGKYGTLLTTYEDKNEQAPTYQWNAKKHKNVQVTGWVNPAEDFTYVFSPSDLALLNSYITDGTFGIGMDPDCHYYNDGVKFCYETITTDPPVGNVPVPGAILLGSIGVCFIGWLRTRKIL